MTELREVEIDCICGIHLSATVIKDMAFDLTCAVCGTNYLEVENHPGEEFYAVQHAAVNNLPIKKLVRMN